MPRSRSPPPKRISLLIRNLSRDARPGDVKYEFERFGDVKDVYLPKDYYTGLPRGIGFVEFYDQEDAHYAQRKMDRQYFMGRELTVVFAAEGRKRPDDMRRKEDRGRGGGGGRRGRSPSPRGRRDRSPSPRYRRERDRPERESREDDRDDDDRSGDREREDRDRRDDRRDGDERDPKDEGDRHDRDREDERGNGDADKEDKLPEEADKEDATAPDDEDD